MFFANVLYRASQQNNLPGALYNLANDTADRFTNTMTKARMLTAKVVVPKPSSRSMSVVTHPQAVSAQPPRTILQHIAQVASDGIATEIQPRVDKIAEGVRLATDTVQTAARAVTGHDSAVVERLGNIIEQAVERLGHGVENVPMDIADALPGAAKRRMEETSVGQINMPPTIRPYRGRSKSAERGTAFAKLMELRQQQRGLEPKAPRRSMSTGTPRAVQSQINWAKRASKHSNGRGPVQRIPVPGGGIRTEPVNQTGKVFIHQF